MCLRAFLLKNATKICIFHFLLYFRTQIYNAPQLQFVTRRYRRSNDGRTTVERRSSEKKTTLKQRWNSSQARPYRDQRILHE